MIFSLLASLFSRDPLAEISSAHTHVEAERAAHDARAVLADRLREKRAARAREEAADVGADHDARAAIDAARAKRVADVERELLSSFYAAATPLLQRMEETLAAGDARPLAAAVAELVRATRERLGAASTSEPHHALIALVQLARLARPTFVPSPDLPGGIAESAYRAVQAAISGSAIDFLHGTIELVSLIDRTPAFDDGFTRARWEALRFSLLVNTRNAARARFEAEVRGPALKKLEPTPAEAAALRRKLGVGSSHDAPIPNGSPVVLGEHGRWVERDHA